MVVFGSIIAGLWLVFVAYWIVTASSAKKNVDKPWRGLVIRVVLFIGTLFAIYAPGLRRMSLLQTHDRISPGIGVAAVALVAGGIAIAIWARRNLGKNWGMPMSMKANPELVSSGPYAYVRHPIYSGVLLAIIGSALVVRPWIPLVPLFAVYFVVSARTEEKRLRKMMPDQYPGYMRRTKTLVPFVY